jgi:hypothetical protein
VHEETEHEHATELGVGSLQEPLTSGQRGHENCVHLVVRRKIAGVHFLLEDAREQNEAEDVGHAEEPVGVEPHEDREVLF